MLTTLRDKAQRWCVGKAWWWRLPLLGGFVYLLWVLLRNPQAYTIFNPLNLAIHEGGHVLFGWAGETLAIAGGTITQLAAPFFGMWNFYRQNDFFALILCFGWLSINLFNVSVYMGDARVQQLDLVSLSPDQIIHDWNYLFSKVGLLAYDQWIAGLFWCLAVATMLLCLIVGGWMLWQMASGKQEEINHP